MNKVSSVSKSGMMVTYDPADSHIATHLEDTPELEGLLTEAIAVMVLHGNEIVRQFYFGRTTGKRDVVSVSDCDIIV